MKVFKIFFGLLGGICLFLPKTQATETVSIASSVACQNCSAPYEKKTLTIEKVGFFDDIKRGFEHVGKTIHHGAVTLKNGVEDTFNFVKREVEKRINKYRSKVEGLVTRCYQKFEKENVGKLTNIVQNIKGNMNQFIESSKNKIKKVALQKVNEHAKADIDNRIDALKKEGETLKEREMEKIKAEMDTFRTEKEKEVKQNIQKKLGEVLARKQEELRKQGKGAIADVVGIAAAVLPTLKAFGG